MRLYHGDDQHDFGIVVNMTHRPGIKFGPALVLGTIKAQLAFLNHGDIVLVLTSQGQLLVDRTGVVPIERWTLA